MFINQGIYLNMNEQLLHRAEFEGFLASLKEVLSIFSERAPSDSSFTVDLKAVGNGYKIVIRIASSALKVNEFAIAQSPFTALDKALVKVRHVLEFWSIKKSIKQP